MQIIATTCGACLHMDLEMGRLHRLCTVRLQVPIPEPLRSAIVVLSFIDFVACLAWERWLRQTFPAKIPPQKGYMAFKRTDLHHKKLQ